MAFGMPDIPTLVVIDDDPHHIDIFIDASQNATNEVFEIECVKTLAEGIRRSKRTKARAIFISPSLLDCHDLEMLEKVSLAVPNASILVTAGARDTENGLAVLQLGARGHLLADQFHRDLFVRAIRKIAERNSADEALFTEEKRFQITLDSIGDSALNTQIHCRITSVSVGTGTVPDPEFKIREVLVCRKGRRSTFLQV
jgi:DNA-binding NarL/FixJ family response regulator